MATGSANRANTASAAQDRDPSGHQFLKNQGRSLSPHIEDRVMIYDCGERSLKVRSQKEVDKGKGNRMDLLTFTESSIWSRPEQRGL